MDGKDLKKFLENWKGLQLAQFLSKRFLTSWLLQNIEDAKRQEVIEKLTSYIDVPIIPG